MRWSPSAVGRRERCSDSSRRPGERIEADVDEHPAHQPALIVGRERPLERLRRTAFGARPRDLGNERCEPLAQAREQLDDLRRAHARLIVVQQRVVGVLGVREAVDVAAGQIDQHAQVRQEGLEVVGAARLGPGVLPRRARAGELCVELAGHPQRLAAVAARDAQQGVVAVGRLGRLGSHCRRVVECVAVEGVEPDADLGGGQALVVQALNRRDVLGAGARSVLRHHRLLVPVEQTRDRLEVGELGHALAQESECLPRGGDLLHFGEDPTRSHRYRVRSTALTATGRSVTITRSSPGPS